MRSLWRPLFLVMLALLVPIVPFLAFGPWLEGRVETWLDEHPAPSLVAAGTIALLSTDVLLPIPSSVVSTMAGAELGLVGGAAASWLGMTLGAIFGFALARGLGRPLAERLASDQDLARMDDMARSGGPWMLYVTRPLPVLAEASVLLLGASRLGWRPFLQAVTLSNLGIALVYAALGHWARGSGALVWAILASIALPLAATAVARWLLPVRVPAETSQPGSP